jgi:hypothetical protein
VKVRPDRTECGGNPDARARGRGCALDEQPVEDQRRQDRRQLRPQLKEAVRREHEEGPGAKTGSDPGPAGATERLPGEGQDGGRGRHVTEPQATRPERTRERERRDFEEPGRRLSRSRGGVEKRVRVEPRALRQVGLPEGQVPPQIVREERSTQRKEQEHRQQRATGVNEELGQPSASMHLLHFDARRLVLWVAHSGSHRKRRPTPAR